MNKIGFSYTWVEVIVSAIGIVFIIYAVEHTDYVFMLIGILALSLRIDL